MPMCVCTFLEHFDFTGKTIRPFCTHEGSGLGHSEADIRGLCPGAKVERGLPSAVRLCPAPGKTLKRGFEEAQTWS